MSRSTEFLPGQAFPTGQRARRIFFMGASAGRYRFVLPGYRTEIQQTARMSKKAVRSSAKLE
jgi:hypothetical protein